MERTLLYKKRNSSVNISIHTHKTHVENACKTTRLLGHAVNYLEAELPFDSSNELGLSSNDSPTTM